jgi:hypothetical protein
VGHPHDDFLDTVVWAFLQNSVESDDESLAALDREPLLPDEPGVKKPFKTFHGENLAEHSLLSFSGGPDISGGLLIFFSYPLPDLRVLDVRKLNPDSPTVKRLERINQIFELLNLAISEQRGTARPSQVVGVKTERLNREERGLGCCGSQRIEVGFGVPQRPIGLDEPIHFALPNSIPVDAAP